MLAFYVTAPESRRWWTAARVKSGPFGGEGEIRTPKPLRVCRFSSYPTPYTVATLVQRSYRYFPGLRETRGAAEREIAAKALRSSAECNCGVTALPAPLDEPVFKTEKPRRALTEPLQIPQLENRHFERKCLMRGAP